VGGKEEERKKVVWVTTTSLLSPSSATLGKGGIKEKGEGGKISLNRQPQLIIINNLYMGGPSVQIRKRKKEKKEEEKERSVVVPQTIPCNLIQFLVNGKKRKNQTCCSSTLFQRLLLKERRRCKSLEGRG